MSNNAGQLDAINACKATLGDSKPYFLYFMTTNDSDNEIVAISYKKDDDSASGVLTPLITHDQAGITATISGHIDKALQDIFKIPVVVNNPVLSSPDPTPTADTILALYAPNGSKETSLMSAVTDINTWISTSSTDKLQKSDSSGDAIAVNTLDELKNILKANEVLLAFAAARGAFTGGSRSRKHRRSHKQKKNKNTKRRYRK
jgi:hypothetical protein